MKKLILLLIIIPSILSCSIEGESIQQKTKATHSKLDYSYIVPNEMLGTYNNIPKELNIGTIDITKEVITIKTKYYTETYLTKDYTDYTATNCYIKLKLSSTKILYISNGIRFNQPIHLYIVDEEIKYNLGYFSKDIKEPEQQF